jgi:serine/threonine protein kinase
MSNQILLEKNFAMINVIGQGGFGRVFKMKHLKSGILVAVKERVKDDQVYVNAWNEEIKILQMIKKRIPDLTTSRFIGTLDDSVSNSKNKYILVEWIEGFIFMTLFLFIFLKNFFF